MKQKAVHIPYGVVTAIAMILIGVILKVTHMEDKTGMQWIGMIPFLVGIILCCIAFSKANDSYVTYGQTFGSGFKASAIIALILILWSFISLYIWPDMVDKAIEKASADMEKQGKLTEEQIDQALSITRKYFKVFMVAGALFGSLLMGAIFSLIGAAIAKKNGSARPQILETEVVTNTPRY